MKWLFNLNRRSILVAILAASVVLRLVVALIMGNEIGNLPGLTDQISYHTLALRILDQQGFTFGEDWWPATRAQEPTAHWSYLYTFYLTVVYGLFGPNPLAARILQGILVGIMQPLLIYKIGASLFNQVTGTIAAAILAFYTYLIYYSPALLTEPFYITAVLATLYLSIQMVRLANQEHVTPGAHIRHALLLGISIGCAVLLRQLFLLFLPFLFLWVIWGMRKQLKQAFTRLAVATFVLVMMIVPFTIYNSIRFDSFVLLNTNAGYALYWANHPVYGTRFESIISPETSNYLAMLPKEVLKLKLNEAELEKELLKRGIQFVLDDPVRYVLLSISRIPSYFTFWPTPNSSIISNLSRMASFGILWPFMLYGIILALVRNARNNFLESPIFLALLFFIIYSLIHILTWTLVRYRLPVDAVLIAFAAYALHDLYLRFRVRFQQPGAARQAL